MATPSTLLRPWPWPEHPALQDQALHPLLGPHGSCSHIHPCRITDPGPGRGFPRPGSGVQPRLLSEIQRLQQEAFRLRASLAQRKWTIQGSACFGSARCSGIGGWTVIVEGQVSPGHPEGWCAAQTLSGSRGAGAREPLAQGSQSGDATGRGQPVSLPQTLFPGCLPPPAIAQNISLGPCAEGAWTRQATGSRLQGPGGPPSSPGMWGAQYRVRPRSEPVSPSVVPWPHTPGPWTPATRV